MKKHTFISLGLILGFSAANTVFAENTIVNIEQGRKDYLDGITEVQRKLTEIKSKSLYIVEYNKWFLNKDNFSLPNKPIVIFPIPEETPGSNIKPTKLPATGPQKSVKQIISKNKGAGNLKLNNAPKLPLKPGKGNRYIAKTVRVKTQVRINKKGKLEITNSGQRLSNGSGVRLVWHEASTNEIRRTFFIGKNITELSEKQNSNLKERLGAIINSPNIKKFLITIRTAEFGGGLVIVGQGKGKPEWIKKLIAKLNYGSHPAEQLPGKAFIVNKRYGKISTASGEFQITYSNWKIYKKYFGFKDFSIRNQRIAAMDLARGSHGGFGFLCLLKGGDGFKYGTQPWESSINSTLGKGQIRTIDFNKLSKTPKVIKQIANDKDV